MSGKDERRSAGRADRSVRQPQHAGRAIALYALHRTEEEGIRLYHSGALEANLESNRGEVAITNLQANGSMTPHILDGSDLTIGFNLSLRAEISGFRMILMLEDSRGTVILHAPQTERDLKSLREPGEHFVSLKIPSLFLTPGAYSFYVKFIYNGVNVGGRYISDKALLTYEGDYNPDFAPGVLSPPLAWATDARRSHEVAIPASSVLCKS
jgi:hypothetical protein